MESKQAKQSSAFASAYPAARSLDDAAEMTSAIWVKSQRPCALKPSLEAAHVWQLPTASKQRRAAGILRPAQQVSAQHLNIPESAA
jgi:hypothetical protein